MTQPTLFDQDQPPAIPAAEPPRAASPRRHDTQLRDHLIRAGHLTESGLGRRAQARHCQCGLIVLAGLDDDWCAFETACDPTPLSPLGEALALIEGRRTLHLRRHGLGWILDRRAVSDIRAHAAGSRQREDVLRAHRCHTDHLTPQATTGTRFPETKPPAPANATPPF